METGKVWVITGAGEGLGPAAVKYLLARKQRVIALVQYPGQQQLFAGGDAALLINITGIGNTFPAALKNAVAGFGAVDFLINNANYHLFREPLPNSAGMLQRIDNGIQSTLAQVKLLLPYLQQSPDGSIINLPPQLCLAMVNDAAAAALLSQSMNLFLHRLRSELQTFNCKLSFLLPGETSPHFEV